ncbi:Nn.00g089140.m01.CDS01 [Neocucurbitaria sp. VM-36]
MGRPRFRLAHSNPSYSRLFGCAPLLLACGQARNWKPKPGTARAIEQLLPHVDARSRCKLSQPSRPPPQQTSASPPLGIFDPSYVICNTSSRDAPSDTTMADRRGVRSASRRKTPTPQSPSQATTPRGGRATRAKRLHSASRDLEADIDVQKPSRRSARQASITTATDESDHEGQATRRTRRKPAKEPVGDLTTVEEIDTQIALEEVPGTPTRTQTEDPMPYRSPGAASEMSGTTAISSFSLVEAEFLEPKYILKHLRKLCESAEEFLEHLAPDNGRMEDDLQNIHEIQKPDSDFTEEYRDFDIELNVHLKHFKNEEHNYIHVRAMHRALFGLDRDVAVAQSGLDLVLYLTNLLIFAKTMIHSDRSTKEIWDALRQLDHSFPSHFMSSLIPKVKPTSAGESALLKDTFDLALELRTQLAILVLGRSIDDDNFNPDDVIGEVFFRSEASQVGDGSVLRGWNVSALGDDESALPQELQNHVVQRLNKIREFFPMDDESLDRGDLIDLEGLSANFPWEATILRLLHWVRLRHRELHAAVEEIGGPATILRNVKQAVEEPPPATKQVRASSVARDSPRKQRRSFGRDRRRSSRKFDPNAPVDLRAIDALKARERDSGVHFDLGSVQQGRQEQITQEAVDEVQEELPIVENQQDDWQPVLGDDLQEPAEQQIEEVEEQVLDPESSGPPKSTADLLKALKAVSKPQKENRPVSIFDRQTTAQRVDFGDGFDETQPTPGPSTKSKGKQPAQPSPRKRTRPVEERDDSDDDAFEAEERGARVQERRQKAPVAKKVRIDPTSSGAPPSHQPPRRSADNNYIPEQQEQEESLSERDAPDMTEEAEEAPSSTYQAQQRLAQQNSALIRAANARKPRTAWSVEEEEAFEEYMGIYPAKYSAILEYDKTEGHGVLQDRTQVNLKDKARTMAINMIKSGTGPKPGFEEIIQPTSKHGQMLIANGFEW